jgi:catalase
VKIFLHDHVAAPGECGILLADERGLDHCLATRILGAIDEPQEIAIIEITKAMDLVDSRDCVAEAPHDLAKRGPDFLEHEIAQRVASAPQRWTMVVTVANSGDPTADPTKAWPPDRRTIKVGTLTAEQVQAERNGPCRDINFDPTVLPSGMRTSDDPFPAARSAAYAKSYDLRTAEAKDYPRTPIGAEP